MGTEDKTTKTMDEKLKEAADILSKKTEKLADAAGAFAQPIDKLADVVSEKVAGGAAALAGLADRFMDAVGGKKEAAPEKMTNKELVLRFIDEVFNAHDLSKLDLYMRDDYMQHSVEVADGKEGFRKFCEGFFQLEPFMDVRRIFESEDNTVAVFFKCCFKNGTAAKVVDMYRIEDGKLAEHWDVVQLLADDDAVNNGRGSF